MNRSVDLEELTIGSLFSIEPEASTELVAVIDKDRFKKIADKAESFSRPIPWGQVQTSIAGTMAGALQSKVLVGWVAAWQKSRELEEKAEKSREASNAPFSCTLLEHAIDSSFQPFVEVYLGPALIQRIDFEVELETEIDGAILNLRNGSIVAIQLGRCEWSGKISIEGVEVIHRDLATLDLPGHIVLKRPIAIAGRKEAVVAAVKSGI